MSPLLRVAMFRFMRTDDDRAGERGVTKRDGVKRIANSVILV